VYHFTVKVFSRWQPKPVKPESATRRLTKSIIANIAYRSGEKLYDERNLRYRNFTRKKGVDYVESLAPPNTPSWLKDREAKWNAVDRLEKRKDARLAREAEFALPRELTLDEQIELARAFIIDNFINRGMCADLCIHIKDVRNPHAHAFLTDRPVDSEGFLPRKDPSWNDKKLILAWREAWATALNREYERKGLEKRVSHKSYRTLGFTKRKPTKHLGLGVLKNAERGQMTDSYLEHLSILSSDHERERLMVRFLEKVRNTREQAQWMSRFLEIADSDHARERLSLRFLEIRDRNREHEREIERSHGRSR
jgi:hypothetical protein